MSDLMKKLDLHEGDTVMTMNVREFNQYLLILKRKIMDNTMDALEFVEQMQMRVKMEMMQNG